MKKTENLGFFRKIILSITDFRLFPYTLKNESALRSFGHFIGFIMLLVLIISIKFYMNANNFLKQLISNYDQVVPEFVLEDGNLSIDKQGVVKANQNLGVAINTDYTYEDYITSKDYDKVTKYDVRILINSDIITYESYTGEKVQLLLKDVQNNINKSTLYTFITESYKSPAAKISAYIFIYLTILTIYGIPKFIDVFIFSIFAYLICLLNRIKMDYKNYLKIAIYAITLPYIVETISILYTGVIIKNYALIISNILAYVYIYYGIRAIKLDAFLLIINNSSNTKAGKTPNSIIVDLSKKDAEENSENQKNENEDSNSSNNEDNSNSKDENQNSDNLKNDNENNDSSINDNENRDSSEKENNDDSNNEDKNKTNENSDNNGG